VEKQGPWSWDKQQQQQGEAVGYQQHGLLSPQQQQQAGPYGGQQYAGDLQGTLQGIIAQQQHQQQGWVAPGGYQASAWQQHEQQQRVQYAAAHQLDAATAAGFQAQLQQWPQQQQQQQQSLGGHDAHGRDFTGSAGVAAASSLGYGSIGAAGRAIIGGTSYAAGGTGTTAMLPQAAAGFVGSGGYLAVPTNSVAAELVGAGMVQHTSSLLPPLAAALLPRALCQGLEAVVSRQPAFTETVGDQAGLQALAQLSRGQQLWVVKHLQEQAATYTQGDEGQVEATYMQSLCSHAAEHNLVAT
jgi:hypothetical protein